MDVGDLLMDGLELESGYIQCVVQIGIVWLCVEVHSILCVESSNVYMGGVRAFISHGI